MIDKATLLAAATLAETLNLPGVGDVRVRGLTRAEAVSLKPLAGTPRELEERIIVLGLVDPALTPVEVTAWYDTAGSAIIDLVVNAVTRLSSLREEAPKSGVLEL